MLVTARLWFRPPATWNPCGLPTAVIGVGELPPVAVTALPQAFTVPSNNVASDRLPPPSMLRTSKRPLTAVGVYRCVLVVPSPICPDAFKPHARTDRSEPTTASACWPPPAIATTPLRPTACTGISRGVDPAAPVPSPVWPLVLSPHNQTVPSPVKARSATSLAAIAITSLRFG